MSGWPLSYKTQLIISYQQNFFSDLVITPVVLSINFSKNLPSVKKCPETSESFFLSNFFWRGLENRATFRRNIDISPLLLHLSRPSRKKRDTSSKENNYIRSQQILSNSINLSSKKCDNVNFRPEKGFQPVWSKSSVSSQRKQLVQTFVREPCGLWPLGRGCVDVGTWGLVIGPASTLPLALPSTQFGTQAGAAPAPPLLLLD